MTTKAAKRSARHAERQKEKGLVRRAYWVPAAKEEEVKSYINKLTNEQKQ